MEIEKYIVINPKTGELIDTISNGDTYIIRRKKQIEYYQEHQEELENEKMVDFGQATSFTMLSKYAAEELAKENLSGSDFQILFLMMSRTGYKTGYISIGNNHAMTNEWIAKTLKINIKTVDRCIKKLIDRGIVAIVITEYKRTYFFNPYIHYKGSWISKDLYNMFKNTKWFGIAKENREKEISKKYKNRIGGG